MLQLFSETCRNSMFECSKCPSVFYMDIVYVPHICCNIMFQNIFSVPVFCCSKCFQVESVLFFRCCICVSHMLQLHVLDVSSV